MTEYLRMVNGGLDVTAGKRYAIVGETSECWRILDDKGDEHYWTKDDVGKTFTLETDAEISEVTTPITLLPDESLGGLMREYREVKRKASVGELVKIVDADCSFGHYVNGDVITITDVIAGDPFFPVKKNADNPPGTFFLNDDEYVVLEPTDVLRIDDPDGVNRAYRIVDRKAAVGERVIITAGNCAFSVGQVITVHGDARIKDSGISYIDGEFGTYPDGKYAVLEPLTSAEPTPLSALPLADQYAENITVLTRKIAQLEEGAKTLEERILALETDSAPAVVKVAGGHVDNALPTFVKTPKGAVLSPQQIRDEIVERAKADVKALSTEYQVSSTGNKGVSFWPKSCANHGCTPLHYVDFIIDRGKRTVVALIRYLDSGDVDYHGIAKCAPGETFNTHIGRAIALYRVLGLTVPAEYLNAPQPEDVRVGDVVKAAGPSAYLPGTSGVCVSFDGGGGLLYAHRHGGRRDGNTWAYITDVVITDDSREDSGVTAASSPRKEAA